MSIPPGPAGHPVGGPTPFTPPAPKRRRRWPIVVLVVLGLLVAAGGTVFFLVKDEVKNITTIADPGCLQGKPVVLENADLGGGTDPAVTRTKLNNLISGLDKAAAAAKNSDVRAAMTDLSRDYKDLLTSMDTGAVPAGLQERITTHAGRIDELCTVGGAQQ